MRFRPYRRASAQFRGQVNQGFLMRKLFASILFLFSLAGPALAQAEYPICGSYPSGQESYECSCPPGNPGKAVWGSGPYTLDSDVCTAALHSGAIGQDGGAVLTVLVAGQQTYAGSEANGVKTRDWGSFGSSFVVDPFGPRPTGVKLEALCTRYPTGAPSYTCGCPEAAVRAGAVWGSGPYTADSDICAAAQHAGLIGPAGGNVTAMLIGGLTAYRASLSYGVQTSEWGTYANSIVLDANQN
jgi:hypothetical protein